MKAFGIGLLIAVLAILAAVSFAPRPRQNIGERIVVHDTIVVYMDRMNPLPTVAAAEVRMVDRPSCSIPSDSVLPILASTPAHNSFGLALPGTPMNSRSLYLAGITHLRLCHTGDGVLGVTRPPSRLHSHMNRI